jgi:hypothetical protein
MRTVSDIQLLSPLKWLSSRALIWIPALVGQGTGNSQIAAFTLAARGTVNHVDSRLEQNN